MNNNFNNNNNMNNNINMNNQNNNNSGKVYDQFEFRFIDSLKGDDIKMIVHGNSQMPLKDLIKNFRCKLCDDSIIIKQYLLDGITVLPPDSNVPICNYGINSKSVIKAFK